MVQGLCLLYLGWHLGQTGRLPQFWFGQPSFITTDDSIWLELDDHPFFWKSIRADNRRVRLRATVGLGSDHAMAEVSKIKSGSKCSISIHVSLLNNLNNFLQLIPMLSMYCKSTQAGDLDNRHIHRYIHTPSHTHTLPQLYWPQYTIYVPYSF